MNKVTKDQFEEMDLYEELEYVKNSDLWYNISGYFNIYHTDGSAFSEYIWDQINNYTESWEQLTECLQYIKETAYSTEIVYNDIENDCWDEWHELDKSALIEIIESFDMYNTYDDLFLEEEDEDAFEGMEELIA